MHPSVMTFLSRMLPASQVFGKTVLEVGSYNVNGTPRTVLAAHNPRSYCGVDISAGPCVDIICNGNQLAARFGDDAFDIVISTELLEHVVDWRAVVSNIKRVVKPLGLLLVTTRSPGFPYHPFPIDVWRFTIDDFRRIFSDMSILTVEADPEVPGVFILASKPEGYKELSLADVMVASAPTS